MQGELRLVLNKDFGWIAHELAAGVLNFGGERGSKHHDLFIVLGFFEDVLDVFSHT